MAFSHHAVVLLKQRENLMRTIKAMLVAMALGAVSLTSGSNESFAGVPTAAAIAPAATASVQGSPTEQVYWRGGYRGYGWRGGYRGYGWRGGYGGGRGWCFYHPYRCRRY
jgi:hypothetical protein